MNVPKIKGRMVECGITQRTAAEKMGLSQSSFALKINGKRKMTVDEAKNLCKVLDIPDAEVATYFFG